MSAVARLQRFPLSTLEGIFSLLAQTSREKIPSRVLTKIEGRTLAAIAGPAITSFFNEDIDYFSRWLPVHGLIRSALK